MTVKKTPMTKIPKTIIILGIEIKIEEDASMPDDEFGETFIEQRLIKLNPKHRNLYPDTFWHEVFHAILAISGHAYMLDEKQEEAIVRCLEHALVPFLVIPE